MLRTQLATSPGAGESADLTQHPARGQSTVTIRRPWWLSEPAVIGVQVGLVQGGARAVPGAGHQVLVDAAGDLDAAVAEPLGHVGDRVSTNSARYRELTGPSTRLAPATGAAAPGVAGNG